MTDQNKTIIEINGVKLEVDLRHAKRIDQLSIGSRVKCLAKRYNDWATHPGVIVGFEPFPTKPTMVVAYLDSDYSGAALKFRSFNADTVDFEVVADLDHNALEIDKASVLQQFDRELSKKELELEELRQKRAFFLAKFGTFFSEGVAA